MKILSTVALVLLGALTLAYVNRSNIIIAAVGFAQRVALSSEPNRPVNWEDGGTCLLYTSPSPRDGLLSRMPSSA